MDLIVIPREQERSLEDLIDPDEPPRPVKRRAKLGAARSWRRAIQAVFLLVVVIVTAMFTGQNIFHYPQYDLDEGTYIGAAWTMVTRGDLFYYTYTYAHPPLGWLQIGIWAELSGGFDQFGMAVNSGRVLMLILTVLSSVLIYRIVYLDTGRSTAALFASLVFATSPLAISLHRQVYLDNIGAFWLLVSLLALRAARGRFSYLFLSSLAFGIAFLTKEVFAVMLPGMVLLAYLQFHPLQRRFAAGLWALLALAAISGFMLLAFLKDELLPPGVLWSSPDPHVSLIETYTRQASRPGGGLLHLQGDFWKNARLWWVNGPVLMTTGTVALALGLLFWRRSHLTFCVSIIAVSFTLFLGRGGIVIYYYVIPMLVLLALSGGLVLGHTMNIVGRWRLSRAVVAPIVLSATVVLTSTGWTRNDLNFVADHTTSQQTAAIWLARNLPPSSMIVMDSYAWQDLRGTSFTNGRPFPNAHYYWPLLSDPVLVDSVLHNRWQSVDYILVSPTTQKDARAYDLPLMQEVMDHSDEIRAFRSGNWTQTLYRVRKLQERRVAEDPMLIATWNGDRGRFIQQGRVVPDPVAQDTTSRDQAMAMLRAVYANDRTTFDDVWGWTMANLQVRKDGLLASGWSMSPGGTGHVTARASATEADTDAALALLLAYKLWGDPVYQEDALVLLEGIWENETVQTGGYRYVVAGDWARGETDTGDYGPTVALSALSPAAYRIFAEADPTHQWMSLVDSTYHLLAQVRTSPNLGGDAGLVPDLVRLDPSFGAENLTRGSAMNEQSISAEGSRLLWWLTLDYLWFKDVRAKEAIDGLHFFRDRLDASGRLAAAYRVDGTSLSEAESLPLYANVVPSLLVTDEPNLDRAHTQFTRKVLGSYTYTPDGAAFWGTDPYDYQAQTWAWMTCALMNGAIGNLWAGDQVMQWERVLPQVRR